MADKYDSCVCGAVGCNVLVYYPYPRYYERSATLLIFSSSCVFMRQAIHKPDYTLIAIIGALFLFGLIMQSSAGTVIAFQKFGDSYFYFKRHLVYFLIGLAALYVFSMIPYQIWKNYSLYFFIGSVVLLLLVFIPGIGTSYGTISKSWVSAGPFSFQPSELVKLTYILFLAGWIEKRGRAVKDFRYGVLPYLLGLALISGLVAIQPDLGTMGIIILISLAVFFSSKSKWRHLLLIAIAGVLLIGSLAYLSPSRFDRLRTFVNPVHADPQGVGYHIRQALIGIGSGGVFGKGLGHSRQKFHYLPEATGDSVFVVLAEELGFIFSVALIGLFVWLGMRILSIAQSSRDEFGRFIAVGIASWIIGQAFVNIGAMLAFFPLTGVPLPFISYGGSALVTSMAAIGILINVSKHTK